LSRFFSGELPSPGPLVLNQRRVFILPTLQGLAYVALLVLVLLIAFVYNNNLAYMLGFLMASIFFVTILHSFKSLAGLTVRAGSSASVFAGESAGFQFFLQNPSERARPAIDLQLMQHKQTHSMASGETLAVVLFQDTKYRGWLSCDTLTLSSSYPLGLFRAWSPLRFDSKVLVYPCPAPPGLGFPEAGIMQQGEGRQRLGGDDFFGLKTYNAGDSIRQIHWRTFAKGRGLQIKQYAGAASSELWLDFETTPGSGVEERLSQLCRWVIDADKAGLCYGLTLPGVKLAPDRGREHYVACLQALAMF
jgi:uncharacterized protein (DUF58 family)